MPADTPITLPQPAESILKWVIDNPQAVRDAVKLLNLLSAVEVRVVTSTAANRTNNPVIISGTNAILPVPLKLAAPIADSTATAASVSTQLNLLLVALRTTGQLPT